MKRPTPPAAPPDPRIVRFAIMGGECAVCAKRHDTTVPMYYLGRRPVLIFACEPCARQMASELAAAFAAELTTWHFIAGKAPEFPDDETTVIGMRDEWSEPKPVSLRAGCWIDHAMRNMVLDESCTHPENKPPTAWADWPAGPYHGKPVHGDGKAVQA